MTKQVRQPITPAFFLASDGTGESAVLGHATPELSKGALGLGTSLTVTANNGGGSVGTPAFSFTGDPDTGMFNPSGNVLAFSTDGTQKVIIDSAGNMGIGTSQPTARLDVSGNVAVNNNLIIAKFLGSLSPATANRLLTSPGFNDNRNTCGMYEVTVTAQTDAASRVKTYIWQAGNFGTSRFSRLDETNSYNLTLNAGVINCDFTVSHSFDGNDAILEVTPTTSGTSAPSFVNISVMAASIGGRFAFVSGRAHPLT